MGEYLLYWSWRVMFVLLGKRVYFIIVYNIRPAKTVDPLDYICIKEIIDIIEPTVFP